MVDFPVKMGYDPTITWRTELSLWRFKQREDGEPTVIGGFCMYEHELKSNLLVLCRRAYRPAPDQPAAAQRRIGMRSLRTATTTCDDGRVDKPGADAPPELLEARP